MNQTKKNSPISFDEALKKSKEEDNNMATYIHLCRVLSESGYDRKHITSLFNKYMPKDEYDSEEKDELLDYLVKISSVNSKG